MKHTLPVLLVVSSLIPCAQAAELGRLFFTPDQRAKLEYNHTRKAAAEGDPSSVFTVNGIVQRKGGARTVWINGVPQNAGNSDEHSPESLTVAVPGKSKPVKVKVGQKLILDQPAQKKTTAPEPPTQPASEEDD